MAECYGENGDENDDLAVFPRLRGCKRGKHFAKVNLIQLGFIAGGTGASRSKCARYCGSFVCRKWEKSSWVYGACEIV